ncbi:MAG: beta-lactamase [Chitinophagaceae bacterium]|nr:beta-lactamase [Chitinophagaceae bacterium]
MSFLKKRFCMKVSLIAVFMLLFQGSYSQNNFGELASFIDQHKKELGSDFTVQINKDGKTIYNQSTGDFNDKTIAPIASCSKWLTAALVMTFVDEGKISLDDPVSKYLPLLTSYGKGYITIRHCLTHTTGIQTENGLMSLLQRGKYKTLEEEVFSFVTKRDIQFNAGTTFWYGGIGLNIAGRVLEVISKKTFEKLMQERLLRPLGMRNTTFGKEEGRTVNPSGGAISTATDYMKFMQMLLDKGLVNGKQILSGKSIAEMESVQVPIAKMKYAPPTASDYEYGLGLWIQEKDANGNVTAVSCPGLFGTWPYIDRRKNYAAIFFVKKILNEQKKDVYLEMKRIIDRALL